MHVVSESYRGLSVMFEVSLDRIVVPVATVVALVGAGMLGLHLIELFALDPHLIDRL